RPDPANLHGFINGTGGKVVRLTAKGKTDAVVTDLFEAVAAPILYPTKATLPAEVSEALPTKLPPLRRDAPTLVVGKIKPGKTFDYTLAGTVAGKAVGVQASLPVPEAEIENYFLVTVFNQWRERKDRPAMIQADRALALAFDRN